MTLPPGRARLSTTHTATGLEITAKTIGTTAVAFFAATVAGTPDVMITSTLSRTSSTARSARPSPQRYSIRTFAPLGSTELAQSLHESGGPLWRPGLDDDDGVAFRWKDYRIDGPERRKTMTLTAHEFIRRFLMHVLPKGFHRIHHYGLFTSSNRAANIARARRLLGAAPHIVEYGEQKATAFDELRGLPCPCPRCGGRMILIEVFARGCEPTYRPTSAPTPIRIGTS